MTDVGLVLGAGGVVGQAYHAGVLSALHQSAGWDPRSADIIVGSSAGSITGTMLRLGVGATDLAAMATRLSTLGTRFETDRPYPARLISSPRSDTGVLVQTLATAIAGAPVPDCPAARGASDQMWPP